MGPPKEILFEIDLVPGTWYLGSLLVQGELHWWRMRIRHGNFFVNCTIDELTSLTNDT